MTSFDEGSWLYAGKERVAKAGLRMKYDKREKSRITNTQAGKNGVGAAPRRASSISRGARVDLPGKLHFPRWNKAAHHRNRL